jgi:hypothetical protein
MLGANAILLGIERLTAVDITMWATAIVKTINMYSIGAIEHAIKIKDSSFRSPIPVPRANRDTTKTLEITRVFLSGSPKSTKVVAAGYKRNLM